MSFAQWTTQRQSSALIFAVQPTSESWWRETSDELQCRQKRPQWGNPKRNAAIWTVPFYTVQIHELLFPHKILPVNLKHSFFSSYYQLPDPPCDTQLWSKICKGPNLKYSHQNTSLLDRSCFRPSTSACCSSSIGNSTHWPKCLFV